MSTLDLDTATGSQIVVENRSPEEIRSPMGVTVSPDETTVFNPAFDITPAGYVTAIITESGIFRAPYYNSFVAGIEKYD